MAVTAKSNSAYRIEQQPDGQWRSVFPPEFSKWSRLHDTCTMAYDYMRNDAGVTTYVDVVRLDND